MRKKIRNIQDRVSGVLLDVGCGKQPYRNEFKQVTRYIGLDRAKTADIAHDLAEFPYPLETAAADWILCTQVLDDLPDPNAFIRELHRLLAVQGGLILSASFVWELHDLPHDYGRPSPGQLRLLLERNGFEVVELQHLGNSWTTLGQVININLLKIMSKRSWWFKLISPFLLMNSLFFYGVGSLCDNQQTRRLPLGFFVVARKK
jgi:SAM-dependent methyltransferase